MPVVNSHIIFLWESYSVSHNLLGYRLHRWLCFRSEVPPHPANEASSFYSKDGWDIQLFEPRIPPLLYPRQTAQSALAERSDREPDRWASARVCARVFSQQIRPAEGDGPVNCSLLLCVFVMRGGGSGGQLRSYWQPTVAMLHRSRLGNWSHRPPEPTREPTEEVNLRNKISEVWLIKGEKKKKKSVDKLEIKFCVLNQWKSHDWIDAWPESSRLRLWRRLRHLFALTVTPLYCQAVCEWLVDGCLPFCCAPLGTSPASSVNCRGFVVYCHWLFTPSQIPQEKSLRGTKIPTSHPFPSTCLSPGSQTSVLSVCSWPFVGVFFFCFFYPPPMQQFPAPPGSAGVICNHSRRVLYLPWDLGPGRRAWNTTSVRSFFDARR